MWCCTTREEARRATRERACAESERGQRRRFFPLIGLSAGSKPTISLQSTPSSARARDMASRASSRGGEALDTGVSPGPVYYPNLAFFGVGPHGTGPEFGMRTSFRVAKEEQKTTQADRPGPKYMLPNGLGKQVESTKRSLNAGQISRAPRKTIDTSLFAGKDSPGPAAYNREALGLKTMTRQRKEAPLTTGMGAAQRFFDSEGSTRAIPGPGAYPIPQSIGGKGMPHKAAMPVFAFGKSDRDAKPPTMGCSPGPIYSHRPAVGKQVDGRRPSSAKYGFGTSSRFPVTPEENRAHLLAVKRVRQRRPLSAAPVGLGGA